MAHTKILDMSVFVNLTVKYLLMKSQFFLTVLACILPFVSIFSQEQVGLRLGNYSGVDGLMLQPAQSRSNHLDWELTLFSLGVFVDQNYGFFEKTNVIDLARNSDNVLIATEITDETEENANSIIFDYFTTKRKKFVDAKVFATLPSILINKEKHSFGVFFKVRTGASGNRISSNYNYYAIDALEYPQPLDARKYEILKLHLKLLKLH